MMERRDKVKKIRKDYGAARRNGKDHEESIVYAVEQNRDCMPKEFISAIYPLHTLSLKVESPEEQKRLFGTIIYLGGKDLWRMDKHRIAVDQERWPDHRIITVKRQIQELNGMQKTFIAEGFAKGKDALDAIPRRRGVIKGIEKEIADYQYKGHDPNLEKRLAAEKRRRERQIGSGNK